MFYGIHVNHPSLTEKLLMRKNYRIYWHYIALHCPNIQYYKPVAAFFRFNVRDLSFSSWIVGIFSGFYILNVGSYNYGGTKRFCANPEMHKSQTRFDFLQAFPSLKKQH
jgi:hypothetical protein